MDTTLSFFPIYILLIFLFILVTASLCTVKQNTVKVLTIFGKYSRAVPAGLHFKLPWESVHSTCSLQNHAEEVCFQAVTKDQATISFNALILYSVMDSTEDSIKKAVFSFCSQNQFLTSLVKLIEGEARTIISEKEQQDVLGIREHLSEEVISRVSQKVTEWGYQLLDLQVTDITFGEQIKKSMDQVVEAANKRKAAENEGLALFIQETKKAEAEGKAQIIKATAEKESWKLKGEGIALFREEVSKGLLASAKMLKAEGIDEGLLSQVLYTEMLKDVAEKGQGKIIFLDGGAGAAQRMVQEFSSLAGLNTEDTAKDVKNTMLGEETEAE